MVVPLQYNWNKGTRQDVKQINQHKLKATIFPETNTIYHDPLYIPTHNFTLYMVAWIYGKAHCALEVSKFGI